MENLELREREIKWTGKGQSLSVLEICGNKIIIGFNTGRIEIYDSRNGTDLQCETVLAYWNRGSSVTCLVCTCAELIVGYADGSISIWDIQSRHLRKKIVEPDFSHNGPGYATSMRMKGETLVVGTNKGTVRAWQYANGSIISLGQWKQAQSSIISVDFNGTYVALNTSGALYVCYQNGQSLPWRIPTPVSHLSLTLHEDYVITGHYTASYQSLLQVFNMRTGDMLNTLTGGRTQSISTAVQGSCILSGESNGGIFIWNLEDVLTGASVTPRVMVDPVNSGVSGYEFLRFGRNMFVRYSTRLSSVKVFDFK